MVAVLLSTFACLKWLCLPRFQPWSTQIHRMLSRSPNWRSSTCDTATAATVGSPSAQRSNIFYFSRRRSPMFSDESSKRELENRKQQEANVSPCKCICIFEITSLIQQEFLILAVFKYELPVRAVVEIRTTTPLDDFSYYSTAPLLGYCLKFYT